MSKKTIGVKAWEGHITLPTYKLGPEDKNPPLLIKRKNPIHPGSSIIYPYPFQENLTTFREEKTWKALFLENDYLSLTILPELGGKLMSVADKTTNEEALYRNHVLKFARIGIRGAWVSGGIEWNFPNGHTVTTSTPIDYAVRENENRSATVVVSDIERVSRMKWSVALTLCEGCAFFETEIRLFNRTFLPNRFWFWSNSAAPASPGLEFITSATKVMTLTDVMNFPLHKEVDLSWDRNHTAPQDLFSLNLKHDFVGWYNHDLDRGLIHYADRTEAQGRKFFTWGNSDDGKIWTELLTDEDGPYSEMQSARLPTQRVWDLLAPFAVESWKEVWYPIRKIGSPVYANKYAAVSIQPTDGSKKLRLGLHVTSSRSDTRMEITVGNKKLTAEKRNFSPGKPLVIEFPLKGFNYTGSNVNVSLTDKSGWNFFQYRGSAVAQEEVPIRYRYKIEPYAKTVRAEDQWLCGIDYEKVGDGESAKKAYEKALDVDPEFSPAALSLGILHLRQGYGTKAEGIFRELLKRNALVDEAHFFLGSWLILSERFTMAEEEFMAISRSHVYGAAGSYLLGGLYLGGGDIEKAIEQLNKAHVLCPDNLDVLAFLACAYRKKQKFTEAESVLISLLKRDPTNFPALAETCFLSKNKDSSFKNESSEIEVKKALRNEPQSFIELACNYARFRLYSEALQVLSWFVNDNKEKTYPLIYYYLGYLSEKVRKKKDAEKYYKLGAQSDPSFVFPHRLESELVLRGSLQTMPEDGFANYYLGNLLCSKNRPLEALRYWEASAGLVKNFSVVHRNLGRTYWKIMNDPDQAMTEYEKALEYDPEDYKLYYELDKLYEAYGLEERRLNLIEKIPDQLLQNDMVAERAASFYTDVFEFEKAIEILEATTFFPWEAYTEGRRIYEDAHMGRGVSLMRSGKMKEALESFQAVMIYPRNIGVGEPFRKSHAEAHFRIGLAYKKMGDKGGAQKEWKKAAQEKHSDINSLLYYEAMSLHYLGKEGQAEKVLTNLLTFTQGPAAEAGLSKAETLYLAGLAYKGLGKLVKSLEHFKKSLAEENSHRRCLWEVRNFTID
jgi:tetratricopeptide (TPR) repeat protein